MEDTDMSWRKSSFSNGGANACIEVAAPGAVLVRDTTDRGGGTLAFSALAWAAFAATVRNSEAV